MRIKSFRMLRATLLGWFLLLGVTARADDITGGFDLRNYTPEQLGEMLVEAAGKGDLAQARELIRRGADVNFEPRDKRKIAPLHSAIRAGQTDTAKYLVERGAMVNLRSGYYGLTPLLVAVMSQDRETVKWLLGQGAMVNRSDASNISTPLMAAVARGEVPTVELLLSQRAAVNTVDRNGRSALHRAVQLDRAELAVLLLTNGAEVSMRDKQGDTPLHLTAGMKPGKDAEMAELLLKKGAEVNATNAVGWTPLHVAGYEGREKLARVLIRYGADKKAVTTGDFEETAAGSTAGDLAWLKGYDEIAQLLKP